MYENSNALPLYDEVDDDWKASIRAMQKEQEIYAEPFSNSYYDNNSKHYTSMDAIIKHSKLEEEQGDSSLCE